MVYHIQVRRAAQKQLDELDDKEFKVVAGVICSLEKNPRPARVKKLSGSNFWRVRVGRYRIVYTIDDQNLVVTIVRVAKRTESTYRGL